MRGKVAGHWIAFAGRGSRPLAKNAGGSNPPTQTSTLQTEEVLGIRSKSALFILKLTSGKVGCQTQPTASVRQPA
jgi:hypothetical protein